jgi:cytochrome c oxidase subunit 3
MEAASISVAHHEHHGPPPANRSSRVEPQLLGMLLFIISEVMVFGAFFTAYFFIRVVQGEQWFPLEHLNEHLHLPKGVAGINTAILLSSSVTLHMATLAVRKGNHTALKWWMLVTALLGATFLGIQINEYRILTDEGLTPQALAQGTIFYGLTGLHGAHVFIGLILLTIVTVRAFRGHFSPEEHRGVEVPGIYWHFVDVMWVIVYSSVYLL